MDRKNKIFGTIKGKIYPLRIISGAIKVAPMRYGIDFLTKFIG